MLCNTSVLKFCKFKASYNTEYPIPDDFFGDD